MPSKEEDEMLEPFFHSVIRNLAASPNGATFVAKLGVDPAIKLAWSSLNLSKSKKMANVIDTRPDLFSRFMTEKSQPMVRLEPLGYDCFPPNPIPPLDKAAAAAARARRSTSELTEEAGPTEPATPMSPQEARKAYMRVVMSTLANREECSIDLPQLGSIPEVQQAWRNGGLDKKMRMTEVLKTRPDLVNLNVDDNGHMLISLTERGVQSVLDDEVPDPDRSICPAPVQRSTRNFGGQSNYRRQSRSPRRSPRRERSRSRDRRDERDRRDGRDRRDARSLSRDRLDGRYRDMLPHDSRRGYDAYGRALPDGPFGYGRYDGHYAAGYYGSPPAYGSPVGATHQQVPMMVQHTTPGGAPPGAMAVQQPRWPGYGSPPGGDGSHGVAPHHMPPSMSSAGHYPPPAQPPAQPPAHAPSQPPSAAVMQYQSPPAPSLSSQYSPAQPSPQYSPGQYPPPSNYPPPGQYAPSQFQPTQPYYRDRP